MGTQPEIKGIFKHNLTIIVSLGRELINFFHATRFNFKSSHCFELLREQ